MRRLIFPAFAAAAVVLLASFAPRTILPIEMQSSIDTAALTSAAAILPPAPPADAH
jgi:hypothetical protein